MRVFQLGFHDEIRVLGVLLLNLEYDLILQLLLDDIDNEQATVISHQAEVLLRVES